jgi:hemoglobin-like flavoprotein
MSLNVELLESSFSQVKNHGAEFADSFYTNLFTDYPIVKPLFGNSHMEEQKQKLFQSLVLVVDSLRKPDVLTDALKGLGTRHVKYGVLPEHYPMVGSALLKTLSNCLEKNWTSDVEAAWIGAYGAVTELMLDGAQYPVDILNLPPQTSNI